jgi:hypothetical protein
MNLLRAICCLFAGRCEEEPKPTKETVRGDLGQTEAELEKAGKERMEHMAEVNSEVGEPSFRQVAPYNWAELA